MRTRQSSKQTPSGRGFARRKLLKNGLLSFAGLGLGAPATLADKVPLRVAVASNFRPALDLLLQQREVGAPPPVSISSASTGVLFQQIRFGAPFDLFLSADQLRPLTLYKAGIGRKPKLYCRGRLALVSRHDLPMTASPNRPAIKPGQQIALADPKLAPYGLAADALLQQWHIDADQKLLATNTAQALQWFTQGKADWALLPLSLVKQAKLRHQTIDARHHIAIDQYLIRLTDSSDARNFEQWLLSNHIQTLIAEQGYATITEHKEVRS